MDSKISKDGSAAEPGDGNPAEGGSPRLGPNLAATSQAFVVQVAAPSGDPFSGRVQHLATADGGNFATPEDLVEIMRRVLRRSSRTDEPGDE